MQIYNYKNDILLYINFYNTFVKNNARPDPGLPKMENAAPMIVQIACP